jgi:hypothetical protein
MKKILLILTLFVFLVGCAELKVATDIVDIFVPDKPKSVPVCDKKTVGIVHKGKICLKYSDNTYKWVEVMDKKVGDKIYD